MANQLSAKGGKEETSLIRSGERMEWNRKELFQLANENSTRWGSMSGGLGDADVNNSTPDELKIANSQVLSR